MSFDPLPSAGLTTVSAAVFVIVCPAVGRGETTISEAGSTEKELEGYIGALRAKRLDGVLRVLSGYIDFGPQF